jgi:hypothetical protein
MNPYVTPNSMVGLNPPFRASLETLFFQGILFSHGKLIHFPLENVIPKLAINPCISQS